MLWLIALTKFPPLTYAEAANFQIGLIGRASRVRQPRNRELTAFSGLAGSATAAHWCRKPQRKRHYMAPRRRGVSTTSKELAGSLASGRGTR
jgi:hypothetical protein